jgi:hypothetical protein
MQNEDPAFCCKYVKEVPFLGRPYSAYQTAAV